MRLYPYKGCLRWPGSISSTPLTSSASLRPRQTSRYVTLHFKYLFTGWCSKSFSIAPMNAIEQSKKLAAYNAVDHHVKPEHRVSRVNRSLHSGIKIHFRSLESDLVRITVCYEYLKSTELATRLNCSLCRGENYSTRCWSEQIPCFPSVGYAVFLICRRDRGFNDFYRVSVETIDCGSRSASWWCRWIPNDRRNTRWCRRVSAYTPSPLNQHRWSYISAGWIIN